MSKASAYAAAWQRYMARVNEFEQQFPRPDERQGECWLSFQRVASVTTTGHLELHGSHLLADHIPALIAWLTDTFTEGEG